MSQKFTVTHIWRQLRTYRYIAIQNGWNFSKLLELTRRVLVLHTDGMTAKPRLIAYVPKHLHAKVIALSKKQGMTQSSVIEDALAVYFSVSIHHERDAALIQRQDKMIRQLARIERDQNAVIEMADMLAYYQLAFAPPMTDEQKDAAKSRASAGVKQFRLALSQRLNTGRSILGEALADVIFKEDDFIQNEERPVAAE